MSVGTGASRLPSESAFSQDCTQLDFAAQDSTTRRNAETATPSRLTSRPWPLSATRESAAPERL